MQPLATNAARLGALKKKSPKPGQGKGEKYDMTNPNKGKSPIDMVKELYATYKAGRAREKAMFGKKEK